ncbi:MAG: hypothetical protein E6H07_11540 [Bacteroidetes bacterium]|nr:MAG: hypothetical protein E6H07_11540 [Bacteroidota bacterium]
MKRTLKTCMIVIVMVLSGAVQNESKAQVSASISFQTFYDELSPYGEWIYYPSYGYVWSPDDSYSGFHPYRSGGHWVWTDDYDWLWASDYDWGWAPFHYGRWLYDSYYGWIWVPDYEWSPAWVVWRNGGGYYGWAPMSPGISINLYFGSYSPSYDYWCFAPRQYINSSRISDYYVDVRQNTTIINNTTVINNYSTRNNSYVTGPSRRDAERYTGSQIRSTSISESRNPGKIRVRGNEVAIYKPSISRQSSGNDVPKKFERYNANNKNDRANTRNNDRIETRSTNNPEVRRERNEPVKERYDIRNQPERKSNEVIPERPSNKEIREQRGQERRTFERPQQNQGTIERPQQQQRPDVRPQQERRTIERPEQQQRPDARPQQERRIIERTQQQERPDVRPQQEQGRIERQQQQQRPDVRPQQERRTIERSQQQQRPDIRPNENRRQRQEAPVQNPNNQQREIQRNVNSPGQTPANNSNGNNNGRGRGRGNG